MLQSSSTFKRYWAVWLFSAPHARMLGSVEIRLQNSI